MTDKKVTLPPLEVSPLIKLVRWACLISGVIYGFVQRRKYTVLENIWREQEEKNRPAREAYLAREKRRINEAQMNELRRIFLGTVSSDNDTFNEVPETDSSNSDTSHEVPETGASDNNTFHEVLDTDPSK